jgi:hypothetical protein
MSQLKLAALAGGAIAPTTPKEATAARATYFIEITYEGLVTARIHAAVYPTLLKNPGILKYIKMLKLRQLIVG